NWGHALLNPNADPVPGEHVIIIQHPNGGLKQIVLTANQVVSLWEHRLHYTTDTMPGSSGSPVFNDSWQVIAIHHAGGELQTNAKGDKRFVNEGILMSAIKSDAGSFWPQ
ncbi:MAG: trypsin-like peptidase domain-containing protein, partial [Anaerolineae bacterium]|nr:trypsin-like peptidase domain-containing protein [Anaerolineae bacterium]